MTDRLLTSRELADRLGVTPETVLRYVRAGELRGIRLPGTVRGRMRFDPDDIHAWLDRRATASPAPRGSVSHPGGQARREGGYAAAVPLRGSATPPQDAATIEEDHEMPATQRGQARRLPSGRW